MDGLRASILRLTTQWEVTRSWFKDRSRRLFLLFLFQGALALLLSLFFPLYVLAIGPLFLGVPHIFASIRYVHWSAVGSSKFAQDEKKRRQRGCSIRFKPIGPDSPSKAH